MAVHGVYKVVNIQFVNDAYDMELHIKEEESTIRACLKDQEFSRTFYNGRTFISPNEKESHNFIFYNAQVDNYINLVPPGGYHIGGVELAGTVLDDTVVGTIKFKHGLTFSIYGSRIAGEPVVSSQIRQDGIPGINRNCFCKTMSCVHHGFCDSCQVFDTSHGLHTMCIYPQWAANYEKQYGHKPAPLKVPAAPPPGNKCHTDHNI